MISQFRRFTAGRQAGPATHRQGTSKQPRAPHPAIVFACQSLEPRRLLADISGIVFHDVNASGEKDINEKLQEGFNVYVDLNFNNVRDAGEPFDESNGFGAWAIHDLAPGNYAVRIEQRDGFTRFPVLPAEGYYRVSVGESSVVEGLDFGIGRYATARGEVFFDRNGNGIKDGADAGLEGITVYIDANGNGQFDPGELSKETNAEGQYRIDYLYPGFNAVRVLVPGDQRPTTQVQRAGLFPSGFRAVNIDFGISDVGNIIGHVFSDLDGDGIQSPGEPDKAGHIVYLDLNGNSQFDRGIDVSTMTNAAGDYYFMGLKPGPYVVRSLVPSGTSISVLLAGSYAVNLQASQTVAHRDFAYTPFGRVRGYVFADMNSDGIEDFGEDRLPGRRIFIDLDGDRQLDEGEPNVFTNLAGEYLFPSLPAGRYFIDMVVPDRQIETAPVNGRHIIDVLSGELIANVQFGVALAGEIRGRLYNDRNGNGVFDPDENGIANTVVYLDTDNDGVLDPDEVRVLTGDAGVYTFPGLRDGTYNVRTASVAGATLATPAGGVHRVTVLGGSFINNRNFGFEFPAQLTGNVFNDVNANGVKGPADTGRPNVVVFADYNGNGIIDGDDVSTLSDAQGNYTLNGIFPGPVTIRIQPPIGFQLSLPAAGSYTRIALGGQTRGGLDFGLYQPATISGLVFNDTDEDGNQDGGETGLSFQTVYLDLDNDGIRDFGEPTEFTDINGAYSFTGLRPSAYTVRLDAPANSIITAPPGGAYSFIVVTSGQTVTNRDFGLVLAGSISGVVFNDLDADGVQDGGDIGIAGQTVYIDTNANNVLDVDELSVVTGVGGTYAFTDLPTGTYRVKLNADPADTVTTPPGNLHNLPVQSGDVLTGNDFGLSQPATISGVVYADGDGDGTRDAGDPLQANITVYLDINENGALDGGEPTTTTDVAGAYSFDVVPGTYDVRVNIPAGASVTQAPGGLYDDLTVTSGQQATGRDFGIAAGVSGLVFDDNDLSGAFSGGDTPLALVRVFADLDSDGLWDAGVEPSVFSDAVDGTYFLPLPPGTYDIAIVPPVGSVVVDPPGGAHLGLNVPINDGVTGVDFAVDA